MSSWRFIFGFVAPVHRYAITLQVFSIASSRCLVALVMIRFRLLSGGNRERWRAWNQLLNRDRVLGDQPAV